MIYLNTVKNNIYLIEDAAESVGVKFNSGKFKGKHTGTVGDIGCFSFNGNKNCYHWRWWMLNYK